jgi:hypothetical protein
MTTPLCEACAKIPFTDIVACLGDKEAFNTKFKYLTWDDPVHPQRHDVGVVSEVLQRACPFCRVLTVVLRSNQLGPTDHWALKPLAGKELERNVVCTFSASGYVDVMTLGGPAVFYLTAGWAMRFTRGPLQSEESPYSSDGLFPTYQKYLSKRLTEKVNFDTIREWLKECNDTHGPECRPARVSCAIPDLYPGLNELRLIDVVNQKVIETSTICDYITLSYIWGNADQVLLTKESKSWLMQPGALAETTPLPATIRDAMVVVLELGLQYLWIDSLCLLQDDTNDLNTGLNVMDLIYEQSVFTIIAADGQNAKSGLHALRRHPSGQRNMCLEIVPSVFMQPDLTLEILLSQSLYRTRAWT